MSISLNGAAKKLELLQPKTQKTIWQRRYPLDPAWLEVWYGLAGDVDKSQLMRRYLYEQVKNI